MVKDDTQISDAEKAKLLKQSLKSIVLAEDVYDTINGQPPNGLKLVAAADPPEPHVGGFFARVYKKTGIVAAGEQRYAVAFRGTDGLSDPRDLDADLEIAFKKLPGQYRQGLAFVERVCKENAIDPAKLEYTGHSLGGYLAITVGMSLGAKKIWTFNSPGPTEKIRDELSQEIPGISALPDSGLVQIRSSGDLISEWGYKEGTTIAVKTAASYHSLANLQEGIRAALHGQPPVSVITGKKWLSSVFNAVTKTLAQSGLAQAAIRKMVDNDHHRKQPKPPVH